MAGAVQGPSFPEFWTRKEEEEETIPAHLSSQALPRSGGDVWFPTLHMSVLGFNLLSVTVVIPSLLPFDNTELQEAFSDSNSSKNLLFFLPISTRTM